MTDDEYLINCDECYADVAITVLIERGDGQLENLCRPCFLGSFLFNDYRWAEADGQA